MSSQPTHGSYGKQQSSPFNPQYHLHQEQHAPPAQPQFGGRQQTEDSLMEGSDMEKIDMILESPQTAFKGNFDEHAQRPINYRVLGTLGIVAITYLFSSGGPIGSEPIMSSGGSLIALISLVVYPLFMTIPYAYIVAELCSAFPEDGGFTIWVLNAFGPFWAFQVGYWSWIAGVIRIAVEPATIIRLLLHYYGHGEHLSASQPLEYCVRIGIALLLGVPALFGSLPVSRYTLLLVTVTIVTFLTYSVWAFTTAKTFDHLFEVRRRDDVFDPNTNGVIKSGPVDIQWDLLINTLFSKFDGIYMASVFGGEVLNPSRTYPRAIFFTVLLIVTTYIIPLPASLLADSLSWLQFELDSFPTMAFDIGGKILSTVVLVGSLCAAAGQFTSGIFIKSFMLSGMASNRLLPMSLSKRSVRYEAPTYGIGLTTVVAALMACIQSDDLVHLSNAFAAIVQFVIIVAAMRLRMTLPYIPRPTKVPGGVVGLMVFAAMPAVVLGYILLQVFLNLLVASLLFAGLLIAGIAYGFWSVRWT
jgi:amino acid transporter